MVVNDSRTGRRHKQREMELRTMAQNGRFQVEYEGFINLSLWENLTSLKKQLG